MLFYEKKFPEALTLTENILAQNENQKTLELKGLILKSLGQYEEAKKNYAYLMQKIDEAGLNPSEAVAPRFDLGVLEYNSRNYKEARQHFDYSISQNFNNGAAHFFRGLTFYQENRQEEAMSDFNEVLKSNAVAIKALTALYLSDLHAKRQTYDEAIHYLSMARDYSRQQEATQDAAFEMPEDIRQNQNQVRTRIDENIQQLNIDQYFKNVALVATYDSNVLSVPSSGSVADVFSGKTSYKATVKALIGHADGFFEDVQKVWSYQFSGNLNENRETETGQFLTNDFNYLWNIKPYADESQSYRLGANSIFQYQVNPSDNKGSFGPYSLAVIGGYSTRTRVNESLSTTWDYTLKYENFLQDPAFSTFMKKTGYEGGISYFRNWDTRKLYFNPGLGLGLKSRYSNGQEYRNMGLQLSAVNQLYFSQKHQASLVLSYAQMNYYDRPGQKRTDNILNLQWEQAYKYDASLSYLFSLSYTKNDSNIPAIYEFSRYLVSAGINMTF